MCIERTDEGCLPLRRTGCPWIPPLFRPVNGPSTPIFHQKRKTDSFFPKCRKKTPEVRISANRINDSAPDVNPEFGARVLPAALQFCRCGGLWNAKGHPDGFPSHDPSLRNFRLGRFFDSLIPVHFFGRMISRSNRNSSPGRTNSTILRRLPTSIHT